MDTAKQMWMLPDLPLQEEHFRHSWNISTYSQNRALLERQQLPCAVPSVDQLCQGLWCAPGIPSCGGRTEVGGHAGGQPGCRSLVVSTEGQGSTPLCSQGVELAGLRLEAPSCFVWPRGQNQRKVICFAVTISKESLSTTFDMVVPCSVCLLWYLDTRKNLHILGKCKPGFLTSKELYFWPQTTKPLLEMLELYRIDT